MSFHIYGDLGQIMANSTWEIDHGFEVDMARNIGLMFGVRLMENRKLPRSLPPPASVPHCDFNISHNGRSSLTL